MTWCVFTGAAEAGKSTIVKQMKRIHEGGHSELERESFKKVIFASTVQSMRVILDAMSALNIRLGELEGGKNAQIIKAHPVVLESASLPAEVVEAIAVLWKSESVQECYKRSNEYQLSDSAK